jgi:two-component system response regulator CitB
MQNYEILIVEDDIRIAELHAQFVRDLPRFVSSGIAGNLKEARRMIKVLKPDLIILDNFLPDGLGIQLMKELFLQDNEPDVILITAANDVETVREAVRCGAFDYLIKPVSYDRLQDTLNRYLRYRGSLNASDDVSQRHIDAMFNLQAKENAFRDLPKGIEEITLDKVKAVFSSPEIIHTAESLGQEVGISKTTARRYLEHCVSLTYLQAELMHGRVGRPERAYRRHD